MTRQGEAATVIQDAVGARGNEGKLVAVHGTTRNAKLGAAVVTADLVVYCPAIGDWTTEQRDTKVAIEGRLTLSEQFATQGETPSAGTDGPVWVLDDCRLVPGGPR
jgi:hypothetical protein